MINLYTWVHSCPQRAEKLDPIRESIQQSDLGQHDIHCHAPGLDWNGIRSWWFERMRDACDVHAEYVLRLDDDSLVNRHILHNLSTWPALRERDFGMGLLWVEDSCLKKLHGYEVMHDTGAMRVNPKKMDHHSGSQGQLFRTKVLRDALEYFDEAMAWKARKFPRTAPGMFMDLAISNAVRRAGGGIYLHIPGLVTASEVGLQSASQGKRPQTNSRTWPGEEWKRPEGRQRDAEPEHLWGYQTRWAILTIGGRRQVAEVRTPPTMAPTRERVSYGGRGIAVSTASVFDTPEAAREALGTRK